MPVPCPTMRALAAVMAGLVLPGCAALFVIDTRFSPTAPFTPRNRTAAEITLVYLNDTPRRPIERVGQIQGTRTEWQNNTDLVNAMRAEAARAGLDGVADFRCGLSATFAYQCSGTGFVYVP
ncbi:hypothetical protein [Plastoroseomonas arctica]|uniref:Uncharacterized protein n=1 Tax=Plastoroseomonas arctica TaxID=1509237 RepID=A0AAF1KN85_9PROT|nr:hypothetical protein [Plastoroseomonas arctica]MBR0656279.1 hypothetical protein [Plastoroseomonas arctica]